MRSVHLSSILPGLLAASVSIPATALAQSGPTVLEPIIITATSGERFVKDAPASVTVVTSEELRQRPVQDLASAVEGAPGIQLTGLGLGRRGISIRGMRPDHSLILVDGMRINNSASAVQHSDYELGWVPAEAIERVEMVRGPMSSLYGSEALGGVVNIITRDATDAWRGSLSVLGTLTEHGRGGNGHDLSFYAGGPLVPGVLGLNLWGTFKGRGELPDPANPALSLLSDEKAFTGNAKLTWTPDAQQRIDLSYGAGFEERWRNTTGTPPPNYRSQDDIWRQRVSLSHRGEWDWGSSTVRLYSAFLDRENARDDGRAPSGPHRFVDTVGDAQVSFSPIENHKMTLGGEVRHEWLKDPTVNKTTGRADQTHYAAFIQDEIALGERWELVVGGRVDHHQEFGLHASPRAYLLHHFNDGLTFKAGVGTGFKAPTLKQLSPGYEAIAGGGRFTIFGNPDLKPETNLSFEAGLEYSHGIWSARAMVFQNDLDNLIQEICYEDCHLPIGAKWTYMNVNKARIRGIELGGGVELPWNLRLDANYTYIDPIDRTTGLRLPERSQHAVNATLGWSPIEGLTTSLRAQYLSAQDYTVTGAPGRRERPGYTLLSVYGDYAFNERASLQFGVENITDVRVDGDAGPNSFVDEGRRYFLGLRTTF